MRISDKRFGIGTGFEACQFCQGFVVHQLIIGTPGNHRYPGGTQAVRMLSIRRTHFRRSYLRQGREFSQPSVSSRRRYPQWPKALSVNNTKTTYGVGHAINGFFHMSRCLPKFSKGFGGSFGIIRKRDEVFGNLGGTGSLSLHPLIDLIEPLIQALHFINDSRELLTDTADFLNTCFDFR